MTYRVYQTRAEAQRAVDQMRGWLYPRIYRLPAPEQGWIVRTEGGYLCADGFVRTLA